jgi:hypothetical protein
MMNITCKINPFSPTRVWTFPWPPAMHIKYSINRFLEALLRGNNIPSPLEGEGRVRGHNYGPYFTDTSLLAAG